MGEASTFSFFGKNNSWQESYYQQGKKYSKNDLNGAELVDRVKRNVKSDDFADFIRSKGRSFRSNEWDYIMETWEFPDGRVVKNHYWLHKSGETWFHN